MSEEHKDSNSSGIKKFEEKVRDLGPEFSDLLDDAKPYLKAIGDVPSKIALHRLDEEVAKHYITLAHEIKSKELALAETELSVRLKGVEEETRRQQLAQIHEQKLQMRNGVIQLAGMLLFGALLLLCGYLRMDLVAIALAVGGFSLYGVSMGRPQRAPNNRKDQSLSLPPLGIRKLPSPTTTDEE